MCLPLWSSVFQKNIHTPSIRLAFEVLEHSQSREFTLGSHSTCKLRGPALINTTPERLGLGRPGWLAEPTRGPTCSSDQRGRQAFALLEADKFITPVGDTTCRKEQTSFQSSSSHPLESFQDDDLAKVYPTRGMKKKKNLSFSSDAFFLLHPKRLGRTPAKPVTA